MSDARTRLVHLIVADIETICSDGNSDARRVAENVVNRVWEEGWTPPDLVPAQPSQEAQAAALEEAQYKADYWKRMHDEVRAAIITAQPSQAQPEDTSSTIVTEAMLTAGLDALPGRLDGQIGGLLMEKIITAALSAREGHGMTERERLTTILRAHMPDHHAEGAANEILAAGYVRLPEEGSPEEAAMVDEAKRAVWASWPDGTYPDAERCAITVLRSLRTGGGNG